jgi:HTH-type transcriptional regulator / antitoxin MqsA
MAERNDYLCPKCSKQMEHSTRPDQIMYRRRRLTFDATGWWCPNGHDAVFSLEEAKQWDAAAKEAKAKIDAEFRHPLMTPPEIVRIRHKLGLSQREAGALFGGGYRAFQKYEAGEVTTSEPMANLLRLVDRHPELLNELRKAS